METGEVINTVLDIKTVDCCAIGKIYSFVHTHTTFIHCKTDGNVHLEGTI